MRNLVNPINFKPYFANLASTRSDSRRKSMLEPRAPTALYVVLPVFNPDPRVWGEVDVLYSRVTKVLAPWLNFIVQLTVLHLNHH